MIKNICTNDTILLLYFNDDQREKSNVCQVTLFYCDSCEKEICMYIDEMSLGKPTACCVKHIEWTRHRLCYILYNLYKITPK